MYLVTGGAGFIGSHVVKRLNERGVTNILVVDNMANGAKCVNLADCVIADYMDKDAFLRALDEGRAGGDFQAILHQGACSNTMESDGRYMMESNFAFSKALLRFALLHEIPFVYASSAAVYGLNADTAETPDNERPLNVYGYSKLAFDQHVRQTVRDAATTVVGLRYFNVYGPRESQKGPMASMVYQLNAQLRDTGAGRLFVGSGGYGDGEQRRDFVFVDDVVDVNFFFVEGPARTGIFNVGTGASRSYNAAAKTLIKLRGSGKIEYIPFPPGLEERFQHYTQADLGALRAAGYDRPFTSLEDGIAHCAAAWNG